MGQDGGVGAAGVFQGVGEKREAVEGAVVVDQLAELRTVPSFQAKTAGWIRLG